MAGNLQGMYDPFDALLKDRGAQLGAPTSSVSPNIANFMALYNNSLPKGQTDTLYSQLNAISDSINSQRQAAENTLAANLQKQHDAALLRRIQALTPHGNVGGGAGGGGGGGGYTPPANNGGGSGIGGGGINLPQIPSTPPVVTPLGVNGPPNYPTYKTPYTGGTHLRNG